MIVKIVKLIIKKDKVEEFKMIFNYSKSKIVNFQGCIHVEFLILFGKKQNYIRSKTKARSLNSINNG